MIGSLFLGLMMGLMAIVELHAQWLFVQVGKALQVPFQEVTMGPRSSRRNVMFDIITSNNTCDVI